MHTTSNISCRSSSNIRCHCNIRDEQQHDSDEKQMLELSCFCHSFFNSLTSNSKVDDGIKNMVWELCIYRRLDRIQNGNISFLFSVRPILARIAEVNAGDIELNSKNPGKYRIVINCRFSENLFWLCTKL